MDMKKVGAFLKLLRKEKGLTQEQAGEIFLVSGRTISRWENGANMPDLSLLIQIAEYYEVEIEEVLNGQRRDEKMDEKLKETLLKVADYSELEKEKKSKAGNVAFALMFSICTAGIILQLLWWGDLRMAAGETAAALAGGIVYLGIMIYNGFWESRKEPKKIWMRDLVISVLCAGFSAILYGICLHNMGADSNQTVTWGLGFFGGILILGFAVLRILSWASEKQKNKRKRG